MKPETHPALAAILAAVSVLIIAMSGVASASGMDRYSIDARGTCPVVQQSEEGATEGEGKEEGEEGKKKDA